MNTVAVKKEWRRERERGRACSEGRRRIRSLVDITSPPSPMGEMITSIYQVLEAPMLSFYVALESSFSGRKAEEGLRWSHRDEWLVANRISYI